MKLFFTSIISIISIITLAQAPQKINYQAIARNASGQVLQGQSITVNFKFYNTPTTTTIAYEETHSSTTDNYGYFNLLIGAGTVTVTGAFNNIMWGLGTVNYELFINGTQIGFKAPFASVPYALFAEKAGNSSPTPTININAPNSIATPTTGVYNISVPSYSAGTGISISSGIIANTATSITPTLVAGTNMIINPIGASNSYTVSSPNYSLSTPSNTVLLLSNGINNSTALIPTQLLSLSGSTLTAGVPTNSVNLATLPSLWTIVSLTNIATTNSLSSVGIGTNSPTYKLTVVSSATNAALYVKSTSASPISGQFVGDVVVSGKTLTDSISISGPGTPTVGSVLVSRDNLGNAKWSGPIMFKAIFTPASNITVNAAVITGIGGTANYSSSSPINVGSGLSISPANIIFTAPQTGYYNLNATMLISINPTSVGNAYVYLELFNNTTATTIARAHGNNSDAASFYYTTLQVNTIAQLTQGQQVILRAGGSITNSGTISAIYSPNLINQFSGNLLR